MANYFLNLHEKKEFLFDIETEKSRIDEKRMFKILELGAGTGILGLILASLSPTIECTITDLDFMLPLMNKNVMLNSSKFSPLQVKCEVYPWGVKPSELKGIHPPYDLVLAADCTYQESLFDLLISTLEDLCAQQ